MHLYLEPKQHSGSHLSGIEKDGDEDVGGWSWWQETKDVSTGRTAVELQWETRAHVSPLFISRSLLFRTRSILEVDKLISNVYQYSSTMQYTSLGPHGQSCGSLPPTLEAALVVRLELVELSPRKPRHATKAAALAINRALFGLGTRAHQSRTELPHQSESLLVPFGKEILPLSFCATSPYSHLSILFYLLKNCTHRTIKEAIAKIATDVCVKCNAIGFSG